MGQCSLRTEKVVFYSNPCFDPPPPIHLLLQMLMKLEEKKEKLMQLFKALNKQSKKEVI